MIFLPSAGALSYHPLSRFLSRGLHIAKRTSLFAAWFKFKPRYWYATSYSFRMRKKLTNLQYVDSLFLNLWRNLRSLRSLQQCISARGVAPPKPWQSLRNVENHPPFHPAMWSQNLAAQLVQFCQCGEHIHGHYSSAHNAVKLQRGHLRLEVLWSTNRTPKCPNHHSSHMTSFLWCGKS